ncbi:MAG: hypothetical protein DWG83_01845 [Chloroflexi bacterium]|nr:hypothetical protein [Chloroflexota bacterium]MDA1240825.1 hypothetical protein [Chloroflexota bacterium]MQC19300.1 hypothetical protein [Chloroflexota bacterium]
MPTYRVTRLWSLAGHLTTEVEAPSEDAARRIEEERCETEGAVASLPPALRLRLEDVFEEIDQVEEI